MPAVITRLFALPSLRRRPYRMLLDREPRPERAHPPRGAARSASSTSTGSRCAERRFRGRARGGRGGAAGGVGRSRVGARRSQRLSSGGTWIVCRYSTSRSMRPRATSSASVPSARRSPRRRPQIGISREPWAGSSKRPSMIDGDVAGGELAAAAGGDAREVRRRLHEGGGGGPVAAPARCRGTPRSSARRGLRPGRRAGSRRARPAPRRPGAPRRPRAPSARRRGRGRRASTCGSEEQQADRAGSRSLHQAREPREPGARVFG